MTGRIDLHCHLLPGIDDGCVHMDESVAMVRTLIEHGYTASVCTPHIWPDFYPGILPEHIRLWTDNLGRHLANRGIDYELIPGGEVRLFKGLIGWMKTHGVPTLGDSKAVLLDTWDASFPKHAFKSMDWLLTNGYQPVLAHPERTRAPEKIGRVLDDLTQRGVLLQGNSMPFTGRDLPGSEALAWRFLEEDRYALLALDLHQPDSLDTRLSGIGLIEKRIGKDALERMIRENPARLLSDREMLTTGERTDLSG